jgi:hypothetical protein
MRLSTPPGVTVLAPLVILSEVLVAARLLIEPDQRTSS